MKFKQTNNHHHRTVNLVAKKYDMPEATMILGGIVAIPTGKAQAAWIQASQKRVSVTSYILGKMKWIRLSGLNSFAFERIQDLRIGELRTSERYRSLLTLVLLTCA